jgi:rare lipoprotein A
MKPSNLDGLSLRKAISPPGPKLAPEIKALLINNLQMIGYHWSMKGKQVSRLLIGLLLASLASCTSLPSLNGQATASDNPDTKNYRNHPVLKTYYGISSWYSVKTNRGRTTASGRRLSNGAYTAAHKTLPFGTKVRVTCLFNGKSEILVITDRGPYRKSRIIDVTIGSAQRLGFYSRGITKVKVEVLEWGNWRYKKM